MSGHSHWAGIKHKKAANDAKRGKIWSKVAKLIMVAAKSGGGDPNQNLALRYAIDKGKAANMPKDTIEKAIKKGTGELGAANYEDVLYEGYAPGGIAVMVEALTDNRNRTAPEIKKIFDRRGGSLGASGCVNWMFDKKGVIILKKDAADEEALMDIVLTAGADDMQTSEDGYQITCQPAVYDDIIAALKQNNLTTEMAEVSLVPQTTIEINDPETARKIMALMEDFEDHDDVQNVSANFDISDEIMAKVENS
jgi:YebC/PmpR family DNA-binding regulatory protein